MNLWQSSQQGSQVVWAMGAILFEREYCPKKGRLIWVNYKKTKRICIAGKRLFWLHLLVSRCVLADAKNLVHRYYFRILTLF